MSRYVVDRDIIENGYILIHGGTRGAAQITSVDNGWPGTLKLNFMFLYSSDMQQIPVDGNVDAVPPVGRRQQEGSTGIALAFNNGSRFYFTNTTRTSSPSSQDAIIPTTSKG